MRNTLLGLALLTALSARADLVLPRTSSPVTVDGDLSDAAWSNAAVIDTFYEYQRGDNTTPPVPTKAYVTYDDRYLYVGIDCGDPDPSKIRAQYVDRDRVIGDQDNVAVLIDSRGEGKVALQLRTNPRGIQADAVNNDSTGTEDFAPDFFYDTATKITSNGWVAEYRIPLTTLRYDQSEPQTWGIMVIRNWPRDFRYTMSSSPLPRGSNCFVCHLTKFTGITGLPSSQHFTAAPYVRAQQGERPSAGLGSPLERTNFESDGGLDLKWSPTPDTAIDATLNPDFSQIEADVAQIATNERFALFYPEKRPFFLEGSDLLDTPIEAVYTRTINQPRWGVRSTSKHGRTSYTLLLTDDRGGGLLLLPGTLSSGFAPQDFDSMNVIGRARHELGRSSIGMLVTARQSDGEGGHNRVLGPDFEWRPSETDAVRGQLLVSDTDDRFTNDSSHALEIDWDHTTRRYDYAIGYEDFGDTFRADNGFIPQTGYRMLDGGGGYNIYPKDSFWIQIRPNGGFTYQTDRDGNTILQDQNVSLLVRGKRNLAAIVVAHLGSAVRTNAGTLFRTNYVEYSVSGYPGRRFPFLALVGRVGQDVDFDENRRARIVQANLSATLRPMDNLQLEANWRNEILSIEAGRLYYATVQRIKATYSFTSKSLLRVIAQYVETEFDPRRYSRPVPKHTGSFTGSVLYSYKLNWQTVFFVGYGDDRVLSERETLLNSGRTLFAKVSYAIQR